MSIDPNDERGGLLSASAAERVYNCPGSQAAAEEAKRSGAEPPQDEIAEEGTEIHDALAEENTEGMDPETEDVAQNLLAIGLQLLSQWQLDRAVETPEVTREQRLWIRNDDMEPLASAKPDMMAVHGTEGFVLDYKSGYKAITSAPNNLQLRLQALALWHEHSKTLEHIRVASAQYRIRGIKDHADYDVESLRMAERELHGALWKANRPNAPRVPGPWCTYCPANASCPQAAAYVLLPIPILAKAENIPAYRLDKEAMLEAIPKLSPQELKNIWDRSALIYRIVRLVGARLKNLPEEILDELGLEKVKSPSVREVVDVRQAWCVLQGSMTIEEFLASTKVRIGELETTFSKKNKEKYKTLKEGKAQFTQILQDSGAMEFKNRGYHLQEKKTDKPAIQ